MINPVPCPEPTGYGVLPPESLFSLQYHNANRRHGDAWKQKDGLSGQGAITPETSSEGIGITDFERVLEQHANKLTDRRGFIVCDSLKLVINRFIETDRYRDTFWPNTRPPARRD